MITRTTGQPEEEIKPGVTPKIVWFEVPAEDVERAKYFYATLFGWKIEKFPGDLQYWHIDTGGGDNSLDGGMIKRHHPDKCITNYIAVSSIDDYVTRIKDLGGQIMVPKSSVQGMGYFALCKDTEGNTFGLWEMDKNAK